MTSAPCLINGKGGSRDSTLESPKRHGSRLIPLVRPRGASLTPAMVGPLPLTTRHSSPLFGVTMPPSSPEIPMLGTMMNFPLTLVPILERAGKLYSQIEVVSRRPDHSISRTTYGAIYERARRLARALELAGLARGDRVATLMWNHSTHLEAYLGIPASGGVVHTLNLRLHPNELVYIVNHARDRYLIVDDVLLPIYESIRAQVHFERVFVVPYGGQPIPRAYESYEDLLSAADDEFVYPVLNENEAAAMCFASGTTGKSK